jgi:hypothetical protein
MLKQSPCEMKKVLAISLIVLFAVSLTAVAVSARGGGGGISGGYSVDGGIYDNPSYFPNGNPYKSPQQQNYAAANQPNYAGYIY